MPVTPLKTVIQNIRTQYATDIRNNDVPAFNPNSLDEAQAHVNYLMTLRNNDTRLPSFEVETITIHKLKVIPPTT